MTRIAIIACNETEDLDLMIPVDLWRRAGFRVETISLEKKNSIVLNSGVKISCDNIIEKTNFEQYVAIFLPGGPGCKKYYIENWPPKNNEGVVKLHKNLTKFNELNKDLYAISNATNILGELGILTNKKATGLPGSEKSYKKSYVDNKDIVVDKNIVSGKSTGVIFDFSFAIIERLLGIKKVNEIKKELYFNSK